MTSLDLSTWKMFLMGGPLMIPILLCSIFALSIIIERWLYFSSAGQATKTIKEGIFEHLQTNNIKESLLLCENHPSALTRILKAGILKFGGTSEEIKGAMEEASLFEVPQLERKLPALLTISHTAPLLGFLGTVVGIANILMAIEARSNSLNPLSFADLSGGIWQALITTIAGLIVAIPGFLFYNFFVSRVNELVLEMERGATELLHLLTQLSDARTAKKGGYRVEV